VKYEIVVFEQVDDTTIMDPRTPIEPRGIVARCYYEDALTPEDAVMQVGNSLTAIESS
jgi:hypothetical protein